MMIKISIVTWNRRDVLARTLAAIEATCASEEHEILVTDNGSTDGTPEMLREMEAAGKLRAWCLKENLGTSGGRNAHWGECLGHDSVRMDDKVLPLCSGWLTALKHHADANHAIVAVPYDPTVQALYRIAPALEYVQWDNDQGQGGPLIYIPGEMMTALGGVDELADGDERCVYGWDDVAYIKRAALLGWSFGFSLRAPFEFLASANPARRNSAMRWHPVYMERLRQYVEAERDLCIPIGETNGYKAGLEARG